MAPYLERNYRGIAPEALLIGSVEQVAERISQLGRMGYTDVITRNITADQPQALATIERLGEVRGLLGGEP